MTTIGIILALGFIIVSCIGIGAWLVVQGHPWFGLFAMLLGGCVSYSSKPDNNPQNPIERGGEDGRQKK